MSTLSYNVTGINAALSAYQFIKSSDNRYAWNKEIWDAITIGGPLDAPDFIAAGSTNNAYLDKCTAMQRD